MGHTPQARSLNLAQEAWRSLLSMPKEEYQKALKDIETFRYIAESNLLEPELCTKMLIEVILK